MFKKKDGKDKLTLILKLIALEMNTAEAKWLCLAVDRGTSWSLESNRFFYRALGQDEVQDNYQKYLDICL